LIPPELVDHPCDPRFDVFYGFAGELGCGHGLVAAAQFPGAEVDDIKARVTGVIDEFRVDQAPKAE
jgi:hypothetical protein